MKLNKLFIATCTALAVSSAHAGHIPSAPQQPKQANSTHDVLHASHKKIDPKAPTAKRPTAHATAQHSPFEQHAAHFNNTVTSQSVMSTAQSVDAAAVCNVNAFATSNSSTLINELKNQGPDCVNELFNASASIQASAYTSDNMYAVANHVKTLSQSYTGGGDVDIEALFLYLRAGYYVEFYNNDVNFVTWVKPAVKGAIDAFVNNANFYQDNDAHGKTLSEVLITMDSSEQQDVYLPVIKEWLSRWNQSYASKWNMRSAVNGIFTLLFRGQYNENFKTLVNNDTTLINRLNSFTQKDWMINSDAEYLIANAARELGRMKMYGSAIQSTVDSGLNRIFSTYSMVGNGDAVWLGAADTASFYGNCADYNICNYGEQLESQVLSQTHVCSPTIKVRSQNLTPAQQSSICSTLGYEESYFHTKTESGNVPIPGDNNDQLQINIFDNDTDYGKYGGPIFGIDTNNGGMYLEGDPSVAGNVPNFVAYEASYADAPHYVWNLKHEYVHYLDGRFDLFGNFGSPTEKVVWWAEGVAEYVANEQDNDAAIATIKDGSTYTLSTIFETTYDGFDQDRIYRWGYLAVRFMFENHFSEVKAMIAETRAGDWTAYKARLNTWVANYSNEFTAWTQTVKSIKNGNEIPNTAPVAKANGPYTGEVNTPISFSSNGSNDAESAIQYSWDFGDGSLSRDPNPTHTYATAGNYTAILTVMDAEGLIGSSTASVKVTSGQVSNEIANGASVSNLSAASGQTTESYFINVPAGAKNLVIAINGANGDADLFTQFGAEPTKSSYNCRPYIGGSNETCTVANPEAGQWFMNVNAYNAFTGLTITASYETASGSAPVAVVNGPYSGDVNANIRFSSAGSYDSDGSVASYSWDFGDGATSTAANPSHAYTAAGNYTVSLTVTDNTGLTNTVTTTATANSVVQNTAPVVYINGPYTGEQNTAVAFSSAGSYDSEGSITSYQWDFGDGATSTAANPSHTYATAGNFTVSLSATDNQGLTETVTTTAEITGTAPVSNVPDMCSVQGGQTGGQVQAGEAICLGNTNSAWLSVGDVNQHSSMAITTAHGTGNLTLEFSNYGWPSNSNTQGASYEAGNNECIYLTNLSEYWGYIKVSGESNGASLVVDFDTNGCR